jgi:hypothetical protein
LILGDRTADDRAQPGLIVRAQLWPQTVTFAYVPTGITLYSVELLE